MLESSQQVPHSPSYSHSNSIRSFSENFTSRNRSNPPSLRESAKSRRKSFAVLLPSLPCHSKPSGITSRFQTVMTLDHAASEQVAESLPQPTATSGPPENSVCLKASPARSKERSQTLPQHNLPVSRSKTLLRKLSTTFRKTSTSSSPAPRRAPSDPYREQREEALRARGLLPPKDLSQLEQEQDTRLSILRPIPDGKGDHTGESAADIIKREYEAKSRAAELDTDTDDHIKTNPSHSPSTLSSNLNPTPSELITTAGPSTNSLDTWSGLNLSNVSLPLVIPLPPSPQSSVALITSKSVERQLFTPASTSAVANTLSPGAVTPTSSSTAVPQSEEVTSQSCLSSPPSSPISGNQSTEDDFLAIPSRGPHHSSESDESSIATPSLDSTSHTISTASLDSTTVIGRTKVTALRGKTHDVAMHIPVIVENPSEERLDLPVHPAEKLPEIPCSMPMPSIGTIGERRAAKKKEAKGGRLSLSTSLMNLRRSLTRSEKKVTVDASRILRSPTVPISLSELTLRGKAATSEAQSPQRAALSPTIYSQGTILREAAAIEDEETRMRTEMAFLG